MENYVEVEIECLTIYVIYIVYILIDDRINNGINLLILKTTRKFM